MKLDKNLFKIENSNYFSCNARVTNSVTLFDKIKNVNQVRELMKSKQLHLILDSDKGKNHIKGVKGSIKSDKKLITLSLYISQAEQDKIFDIFGNGIFDEVSKSQLYRMLIQFGVKYLMSDEKK